MSLLADRLQQDDVRDLPDWAAAKVLNDPDLSLPVIVELRERLFGIGTILSVLGVDRGAAFLDSLEAIAGQSPAIRWAMVLLKGAGIDAGNQTVREQIDGLVAAGLLSVEEGRGLKALGEERRYRSWAEANGIEVTARTVGLARGAI